MRKLARESAFKIVYKSLFLENNYDCEEILDEDKIDGEDREFAIALVNEYKNNKQVILQKIEGKSKGFALDRMFKIDLAILGVALAELLYYKQTPYKIVVNEAVEMAKKYSTEKSYSFINGILKSIIEDENVI